MGKEDRTFTYKRLKLLELSFAMHQHVNSSCVPPANPLRKLAHSDMRDTRGQVMARPRARSSFSRWPPQLRGP